VDLKRCFKCGTEKPRTEFYAHPQMGDGLLGKCKDCAKYDVKLDRQTNPHAREYDRQRASQPHRVALRARVCKEWDARFPDRARAHNVAGAAVKSGKLIRPVTCEGCGLKKKRIEKHHPDYAQPLVVVWLCKTCHSIADKIRRRLEVAHE
jgi:hypothetical protein